MSSSSPSELTLRGIILGAVITLLFTAANIYLGLKVGLTFASSIPAAVISMGVLRFFKSSNILENNMVQTQASAAGTLSSVIFILPGLLMMGYWSGFPFWQTTAICAIGGILGVLFTIPLRRVMVVHSDLPYPEGVAAAEILRVGSPGSSASAKDTQASVDDGRHRPGGRELVVGGVLSALFALCASGFRVFSDSITFLLTAGRAAFQIQAGFSLAMVGAGYLMGIGAGIAILVGICLTWGIFVPWVMVGEEHQAGQALSDVAMNVWSSQVRFLGAGVIGVAAVWTLITLLKPMITGVLTSLREAGRIAADTDRRDRDLPSRLQLGISVVLLALLLVVFYQFLHGAAPDLAPATLWGAIIGCTLFAFIFGFLVAAACGYMAGLIGSSSSPISGIGIIAVILVSLLIMGIDHLFGGLTANGGRLAISLTLFTTSVVIAMAAISNDNLQDLKAGWMVGATPAKQQIALIIGCVVGALIIAPVLELLYQAYGFTGALPRPGMDPGQALGAPQATLMTAIAQGIFQHKLDWAMLSYGVVVGIVLIVIDTLLRKSTKTLCLPVIAVGMGIYLPASVNSGLIFGAIVSWFVHRHIKKRAAASGNSLEAEMDRPKRRGVLVASGLIVGESLVGILIAALIGATGNDAPLALVGDGFSTAAQWISLVVFIVFCVWFYSWLVRRNGQRS